MEWQELSPSAANVLERCWSLHHDKPLRFSVPLDTHVQGALVTMDTYKEIVTYQPHFPHFHVELQGNLLIVAGTCSYGSWL